MSEIDHTADAIWRCGGFVIGLGLLALMLAACGDNYDDGVAYVIRTGGHDNPRCSADSPCATIGAGLASLRREIRISGNFKERVTIRHRAVSIVGVDQYGYNSPSLTWTGRGAAIKVEDGSHVEIRNLIVTGATDPDTFAVMMDPCGTCRLSILESEVWGNAGGGIEVLGGWFSLRDSDVSSNPRGGIELEEGLPFEIINNDISRNGSPHSIIGGLSINAGYGGVVSGNVLIDNQAQYGIGSAISCIGGTSVHDNYVQGEEPTMYPGFGACQP